jgi:hypothetical protein
MNSTTKANPWGSREIEARKHVLFEDMSVVREHERFFEEVIVS